jgi:hypothetical protein
LSWRTDVPSLHVFARDGSTARDAFRSLSGEEAVERLGHRVRLLFGNKVPAPGDRLAGDVFSKRTKRFRNVGDRTLICGECREGHGEFALASHLHVLLRRLRGRAVKGETGSQRPRQREYAQIFLEVIITEAVRIGRFAA